MPFPRRAGPVVIAALVACVAGCAGANGGATANGGTRTASGRGATATWLFAARALRQVRTDPDVRTQLDRARIFEIVRGRPPQPGVIPTIKFASYANMKETLAAGGLPRWVRAVLYDTEAWRFTPAAEQRAPGHYMALAAELAHRHHLLFLASPALDLTTVLAHGATRRAEAYLDQRLAAQAAETADVVDIQAQSLERSTHAYVDFVRQAAAQARQAKAGVTVLAGISSNPTGPQVSADQIIRAMTGVRAYVDGYWMNIPSRGRLCPRCNPARPDLAIAAIRSTSG